MSESKGATPGRVDGRGPCPACNGHGVISPEGAALVNAAPSLAEENARLSRALEFYSKRSHYSAQVFRRTGEPARSVVAQDGGEKARSALDAARRPSAEGGA